MDVVILHRAPEPPDHDIVRSPVFAVHTDFFLSDLNRKCGKMKNFLDTTDFYMFAWGCK